MNVDRTSPPRKAANTSETPVNMKESSSFGVKNSPSDPNGLRSASEPVVTSIEFTAPMSPQEQEKIRHVRALNLNLENIFLVSFRSGVQPPMKYVGDICRYEALSAANISEVICTRLGSEQVVGGAIGYLVACYKRLQLKEQSSTSDLMTQDLALCRDQVCQASVVSR